jgi:hypothetical protein
MPDSPPELPAPLMESRIYLIRGQKVLLDSDLAELYEVSTENLNQAVQRDRERFPEDFMFQLTVEEAHSLRFQIGISKGRGGRRDRPYVFTEQGIALLSDVLMSPRAIAVNIVIMRTFVKSRQLLAIHEDLVRRLDQLEWRLAEQFAAIQHLMEAPAEAEPQTIEPKRRIGFPTAEDDHGTTE